MAGASYLPVVVANGDPSASVWAYRSLMSGTNGGGGVTKLTAGPLITLSPSGGTGEVQISGVAQPSTWVGTATSDLNMNAHKITNSSGNLTLTAANSHVVIDAASVAIGPSGGNFVIAGAQLNSYGPFNFNASAVSNCGPFSRTLGAVSIQQPVIQYGRTPIGSGGSGTGTITIPHSYTDSTTYQVQVTMFDSPSAQLYATPISGSQFTVGWSSGGGGAQIIMWTTFGT